MTRKQTAQPDDVNTAFPASEATPGQAVSRQAREQFLGDRKKYPWWDDYLALRLEGWDWRKASYIAWASSKIQGRKPTNQEDLAIKVLGLRSDRTLRKWREKNPEIDERVATLQIEPLMKHRRDVIETLIDRAESHSEKFAYQYQKILLTMTGDLGKDKKGKEQSAAGELNSSPNNFTHLNDEEFEKALSILLVAQGLDHVSNEPNDPSDQD